MREIEVMSVISHQRLPGWVIAIHKKSGRYVGYYANRFDSKDDADFTAKLLNLTEVDGVI